MVRGVAPSGVVARITLATVVVAPEPLTRYAVGRTVEARFGGERGVLRTRFQHAYDLVPELERAGLIRAVGTAPRRGTRLLAATPAGVEDWRGWLAEPITMPNAMTAALLRLKSVLPRDYATMLGIIDRYEALLQRMVHQAIDPVLLENLSDRIGLLWNRRELVAQLQWCQHARDYIEEEMMKGDRR